MIKIYVNLKIMRNVLFPFKQIFWRIKCIFSFVYVYVSRCKLRFILLIGIFEEFILGMFRCVCVCLSFRNCLSFYAYFKEIFLIFPDVSKWVTNNSQVGRNATNKQSKSFFFLLHVSLVLNTLWLIWNKLCLTKT